jgi:Acetyltransferase (GNAT) family
MLMRHVIELAECRGGIMAVSLNVQVTNERAIAFYHRLGFQQVYRRVDYYGKRVEEEGRDAYHMVRPIKTTDSELPYGGEKEQSAGRKKSVTELLALNCRLSDDSEEY